MRPLLIILLLMLLVKAPAQTTGFGKPLLWYTVYDPWASFMGADGPIFALYETGRVLYWRDKSYHLVMLSKGDLDELLEQFHLNDTFFLRSKQIADLSWTDQPTYVLRLNIDTLKSFSFYGSLRNKELKRQMPTQLLAAYTLTTSFDNDEAVDWLPDKIEVLLSNYAYSPDQPIPWPTGWPDLTSPDTRSWQGGKSLYLDNRYFAKLQRLLASRKEKQAFQINGKKFYAGYRLPLPGVDSVLAANRRRE